jgi:Uma2 family endonuclease
MGEAGIFSEDDRLELIEGELIDMAPLGNRHSTAVRKLIYRLSKTVGDRALLDVQNPVVLDETSEPEPDLVLLRPNADFYAKSPPMPADVLLRIKVADTSLHYDRSSKIPLYARHGIPEVWLVDLAGYRVEVFREPSAEGYCEVRPYGPAERLRPSLLPEIEVDLADVSA